MNPTENSWANCVFKRLVIKILHYSYVRQQNCILKKILFIPPYICYYHFRWVHYQTRADSSCRQADFRRVQNFFSFCEGGGRIRRMTLWSYGALILHSLAGICRVVKSEIQRRKRIACDLAFRAHQTVVESQAQVYRTTTFQLHSAACAKRQEELPQTWNW